MPAEEKYGAMRFVYAVRQIEIGSHVVARARLEDDLLNAESLALDGADDLRLERRVHWWQVAKGSNQEGT